MAEPFSERKRQIANSLRSLSQKLRIEHVVDAFQNAITGAGTSRSKSAAGEYVQAPLLSCQELETLFESHDLAYVIVAKPVEDALRDGFQLEHEDLTPAEGDDEEGAVPEVCDVMRRWNELKGRERIENAAIWGRLFGGGGLILGVKTEAPDLTQLHPYLPYGVLATPLRDDEVKGVEMLVEWDRQDMVPERWYPDGEPELYRWTPPPVHGSTTRQPTLVHESRLLMFTGAKTTSRGRQRNQGWHHSVLQRVYNTLKSFDNMFSSVDAMFADASQAVFKLQGLIQTLAEADGSGNADVQTRLQLMDLFRSTTRMIALDAGDETGTGAESFEVVDRDIGPLAGIVDKYYVRLAAAARMPLTVLLGMSPAGMDATGESDMILYYNMVDIYRKAVLEPAILRLVRMIARELGDADPSGWKICWPELARPKPLDVKTAEKMAIDAVCALIVAGVATPEEVALSLPKIAPTLGLVLDAESRSEALEAAMEEIKNREQLEPDEPLGAAPATKSSERKTPSKTAGRQV